MKTDVYFASSVAIALAVPAVFGGLYFVSTYYEQNGSQMVEKLEENVEIVLLGNRDIEEINFENIKSSDYEKVSHIDFDVDYLSGDGTEKYYSLILNAIELSSNILPEDVTWELRSKDSTGNYDITLSKGNFTDKGRIKILDKRAINLNQSQNYRLYYYISNGKVDYKRGTIKATVSLE